MLKGLQILSIFNKASVFDVDYTSLESYPVYSISLDKLALRSLSTHKTIYNIKLYLIIDCKRF